MHKIQRYGWHSSSKQRLDNAIKYIPLLLASTASPTLPTKVDLRTTCIPKEVYDQGQEGSCTGNACAALMQSLMQKQGMASWVPSRNFIYYNERVMQGTVNQDSGASLSDGMAVIANVGAPTETQWAYNHKTLKKKPPITVYAEALNTRVAQELNITQDVTHFKSCLSDGFPFVAGFNVYESFESDEVAQTGVVNLPLPNEELVGGHAVLVVGYDDAYGRFIVRNSWGEAWGQDGYFTIPYTYFTNPALASDFWCARELEVKV